jgi:molybdopterin/thiamine biosynthesis adenylyltransferase
MTLWPHLGSIYPVNSLFAKQILVKIVPKYLLLGWLSLIRTFFCAQLTLLVGDGLFSLFSFCRYVAVKADTSNLNEVPLSFFDQFNCVVLVNAPLQLQLKVDEYCRSKDIPFVSSETHGLLGSLFCDFGREFEIQDKNGEEPLEFMIADISKVRANHICRDTW